MATPQVSYRPFENLRVRVPHHDPEQGRRVRVRQAHPTSKYPEEDRGAVSLSNRFRAQIALDHGLRLGSGDFLDGLMSDRG